MKRYRDQHGRFAPPPSQDWPADAFRFTINRDDVPSPWTFLIRGCPSRDGMDEVALYEARKQFLGKPVQMPHFEGEDLCPQCGAELKTAHWICDDCAEKFDQADRARDMERETKLAGVTA